MSRVVRWRHIDLPTLLRTYLSVEGECPVENGQSVSDGGVVHTGLIEALLGQLLFLIQVLCNTRNTQSSQ